jgi:hypothetical protein
MSGKMAKSTHDVVAILVGLPCVHGHMGRRMSPFLLVAHRPTGQNSPRLGVRRSLPGMVPGLRQGLPGPPDT